MDGVIARLLPDFAVAPLAAGAASEPDFDSDWFRPAARLGRTEAAPPRRPTAPRQTQPAPAVAAMVEPAPAAFVPLSVAPSPARPAEDREALIAEAEARGRAAGRAEAEEAAAARIASERAAFQDRLAEARQDWAENEGAALADGLTAAFARLDAELSERVARLLAPVLTESLRRQAVAALSVAVTRLLAEPQPAALRVTGPEDLITALSGRLGHLSASVAFTAADTPEVTVTAGETVIETELAAWGRLIAAAVAEA
ncbi:hypothetical protein [Methylobacterium sp. Leaf118]|uniref:hypothetical protein n=1 Tax=Methylobacterium sp. Leaf118 TaxID=2876562 RepID=UPI001E320497|nr:hypothetical protein [Methylobacterium sp. Leaf118]